MRVRGLAWLGTRTDRWAEMTRFCKDVLGMSASHEEQDFMYFRAPDGNLYELTSGPYPHR